MTDIDAVLPVTLPIWQALSPAEKTAIIEPMWNKGDTSAVIAACFIGATRNSILGHAHRHKFSPSPIKPPGPKPDNPRSDKPKKSRKPIPAQPGTPALVSFIPDPDMPTASVMDMITNNRPPLAGTVPIALIDLPTREGVLCRFPVAGGYCGVPSGDAMYCKTHHAIMYRPTEFKVRVPREARL